MSDDPSNAAASSITVAAKSRSLTDAIPQGGAKAAFDYAILIANRARADAEREEYQSAVRWANIAAIAFEALVQAGTPDADLHLARSCSLIATWMFRAGEAGPDIYPTVLKSVVVYRNLARRDADRFLLEFAYNLERAAGMVSPTATAKGTLRLRREAVEVWERLARRDFRRHGSNLVGAMKVLHFELKTGLPGSDRYREAKVLIRRLRAARLRLVMTRFRKAG